MPKRKNGKLSPKQQIFVAEYLRDPNVTQAALKAGYSEKTARVIGQENLQKPAICQAIENKRSFIQKKEEKVLMEAFEVEYHLDMIIRFNLKNFIDKEGNPKPIHELSDEDAACVRELGILETAIGTHRTLKFYDKLSAIKAKMERLGLFEKAKQGPELPVETYEQRRRRLGLDKMTPEEAFDKLMGEWCEKKGYALVKKVGNE